MKFILVVNKTSYLPIFPTSFYFKEYKFYRYEMPAAKFEIKIKVLDTDIDENGHVNNVVYLRWVQDAAAAHWKSLATGEQQQIYLWVVRRHEIDYLQAADLKDEITGVTWVGEASGLAFERHTEILRSSDRKLLAKARTLWIPINSKTGKPARVDQDVRRRFSYSGHSEEKD